MGQTFKPTTNKKNSTPDPVAVSEIKDRYFTWLIQREAKKLRMAYFVGKGKKPIRMHQA